MVTAGVQARPRGERRAPLLFGAAASLFGCYHEPRGGPQRECAVVLCQPFGQEYIRAHRALVQLASRLASAGFPVLRFDYFGCGDSGGEAGEGHIQRWIEDTVTAAGEVRRRSGAARLCLVGLRLGGSLAALAGAARGDVDTLVLWEPVVRGRSYLDELQRAQSHMLRHAYVSQPGGRPAEPAAEALGFALPPRLRRDLEAVDLLELDGAPAGRALLLESDPTDEMDRLRVALQRSSLACEYGCVADRQVWRAESSGGTVPHLLLDRIVSSLSAVYP